MIGTSGPPFLIEGLPAGQGLELILLTPASGDSPGSRRHPFQVQPGAVTRLPISLRPAPTSQGN